jgi:drug/metabolite transporter (DMT)-like permease
VPLRRFRDERSTTNISGLVHSVKRPSWLRVFRWELALVAVTAVWGSTFVVVRDAVAQIPPFTFIAWRFLAAAALLAVLRPRLVALPGREEPGLPLAGMVAGLALFAGYGFQTVGLQYTTASNAGFITGWRVSSPCYTSG